MLKFPSGSLCWSSTTDAVAVKNSYFHKTLFHFLLATKVQLRCKIIFSKSPYSSAAIKDCSQVLANLTVGRTVGSALKDHFQINI